MRLVFSLFYWCFVGFLTVVIFLGALVIRILTLPWDPNRVFPHLYSSWVAQLYLRSLPGCRILVEGREKIAPNKPYILVANHQARTDFMALSALMVHFKWVSKIITFRIPFLGWTMSLNGYVSVHRGNIRTVRDTMAGCRRWLKRGVPVFIFPEGHLSRTGEMLDFHPGAFKLAAQCGCPIVPIVVDGTRGIYRGMKVWPPSWPITIHVLDPVTVADAGGSPLKLRDHVHRRMEQELAAMRGQTGLRKAG